jgi:hypothetical protein
MKLIIFYSWQATTATKYNKNFILTCIEKAVKKIEKKPEFTNVEFVVQEGVRGEPGSPGVASKITDERIPKADIFIADLSVVNQISSISKGIQKLFGDRFKPFQNNNVMNEHGVASNAIGFQRIIGVLNSFYGSPNENPENIAFDIRHLRFPIEYSYSKKTKETEKQNVQNQLINELSSAIRTTAIYALQHQINKYNPLIVWSEWEKSTNSSQKYFANKRINELKKEILEGIKNPQQTIRLLGLSGLGKTRILLEVFRPDLSSQNSIIASSRVLYINHNLNPNTDYQSIFSKLINEKENRIVILDNCPLTVHRQLLHFTNRPNNGISLISLDSNPEEIERDKINGVNYLLIKKEDLTSVVNDILSSDFSSLGKEEIEKIREFSQGIPLMAVLLGESVKNGEKFIGKLDDKDLLDKLLGPKGQDPRNRTFLKSCSMFNFFGFYDELISQIEFIAKNKNITSIDGSDQVLVHDLQDICNYYLKREIFEKRGRFLGMRPFPLALSLAQEWLEPCSPQRLINVIDDIGALSEPDRTNLSEALSEQMKYLGYNDKAISIVDKIIAPTSSFDDAEVLDTELGSRLFRSFVEVNPVAVGHALYRLFASKSTTDLVQIKKGRRNLVWVLEKLCFDKRTFAPGAKVLFAFAVAENETWANNATGQFLQLFNIQLAGTEATLTERFEIIEWGLNKTENRYVELAIKAMSVGLNFGNFSRAGGAEKQGSRELQDHVPTWQEVETYWKNILDNLLNMAMTSDTFSNLSATVIASHIRSTFDAGFAYLTLPYIIQVSEHKNNDWDEGLQELLLAKKYKVNKLSHEQQTQLDSLIDKLTKRDFATRYVRSSGGYRQYDLDNTSPSVKHPETMSNLAEEFIRENIPWDQTFPLLFKSPQYYSFYFGKRVFELLSDSKEKIQAFIDYALETLLKIDKKERNVTVLGGFMHDASPDLKEAFYLRLKESVDLSSFLFYFISLDASGGKYLDLLFELADDDTTNLSSFEIFSHGNALLSFSEKELEEFVHKLFTYGNNGIEVAFNLLYDLGYRDEAKKALLSPLLKECILNIGAEYRANNHLDSFKWTETICEILENAKDSEFAKFINNSIIRSITLFNSYHLDMDIQKIYFILVRDYFSIIWQDLSEALLSKDEEYVTFYGLKNILGSHIGGVARRTGVLFTGIIDPIFEWCEKRKPLAPIRLAELVPIFDSDNTDYSKWNPITLRLINEYGEIQEVLQNLNSNMGTYSWVGSIVPFLEAKRDLFRSLLDHRLLEVRDWAERNIYFLEREIIQEKNRDEEMFLS